MSDRWYYQLLMEEFGPVSQEFILEQLACGTLGEGDLVRSEAGGDWMLISAMKETYPASDSSESMAEEIQDLSELNFKFENSRSVPRRSTVVNTPSPSLRSDNTVVPKPSVSTRDIMGSVPAEAPVRKRTAATAEANQPAPASREQKQNDANGKRKRVVSDKETSKAGRSKRISSTGSGVNDELPDNVFNDVFQKQDSAPQRSLSATASMGTSPTSAGFNNAPGGSGAIGTASSSSMSSPAGKFAGTGPSSTPEPVPYSASPIIPAAHPKVSFTPPPKKRVSVSEPMDVKKVGTVAGAVTVIAGVLAVSIFGSPFGGGGAPESPFDPKATAAVLTTILKNFSDLTMTTDESAFADVMDSVKPQMAAILATTQDPKNNSPEAAACQAATKALMKIAESLPDKQEEIEQGVVEFQKQIALVQ